MFWVATTVKSEIENVGENRVSCQSLMKLRASAQNVTVLHTIGWLQST